MIYLIAMLHAVPVFVIGLTSGSRSRCINTAVFMACLGVITGNPTYIAVDLVAVGLALWISLASLGKRPNNHAVNQHSSAWVSLGGSDQPIVKPQNSPATAAPSASPSNAHSGDQPRPILSTSGEKQMGFLSATRLSSLYDKRIRAYGLEPRSLPPDLHATICSSFERRAERFADMSQMTGMARREFIETSIETAADLLVLCLIGPESYGRGFGIAPVETIEELARTWIADGPEGSIELQLMDAVNQAGYLSLAFADAFKSERARQNREIQVIAQSENRSESRPVIKPDIGYADHSARLAALRASLPVVRPASIAINVKRPK